MADDLGKENEDQDEDFGALTGGSGDEEGFGTSSLPPLSDFDSAGGSGGQSDSDLPPLDTPGASGEEDDDSFSGLPPIVDIKVDTPAVRPSDLDTPTPSKGGRSTPSKGRVTPPRSGAGTPSPAGFETPSDSDLASPSDGGFGFQDFAADSDFSPETPEIGPGPDSDIETPMFDSAFGGDSDEFSSGIKSSAPTQAMQTPMFGGGDDDFGATPEFGMDAGTPVPDFSPDTGAGMGTPSGHTPPPVGAAGGGRRGSPLASVLIGLVALILGLAGGAFVGPLLIGKVPGIPDPFADDIAQRDTQIEGLNRTIADLRKQPAGQQVTKEELDKLIADINAARAELGTVQDQLARGTEELTTLDNRLALVREDIEQKNNEFVEAQGALDDLRAETAITQARHKGLLAENDRLTDLVGQLESANARRQATKDTLLHNTELLIIQIQGGSPLTPERYAYQERLTRANALRDKVARAKWVDPQLLDEYTSLYLSELGIASSREYFYARIPLKDSLGNTQYAWAECLMNGNWSVYFRTIDGNYVGTFENTAGSGPPQYEFRQDVPGGLRSDIVDALTAARPEDWKDKFKVLREKQAIYEDRTDLQRDFASLQ